MISELPQGLYQLVTWPDDRLLKVSDVCTKDDVPELQKMIKPMIAIMKDYNGVGLAAVQIGVHKRFCLVLTGVATPNGAALTNFVPMINPIIIEQNDLCTKNEGCLSLPGFNTPTSRYEEVVVKYLDMDWNEQTVVFTGLEAQCIQHEIAHFDGKPLISDVSLTKREIYEKKLAKLRKRGKVR